jgi:hypothetical protein
MKSPFQTLERCFNRSIGTTAGTPPTKLPKNPA